MLSVTAGFPRPSLISSAILTKSPSASAALIASVVFLIKTKKHRFYALFTLLLCLAVSISSFSSFFFVSRAQSEALSLVGKNTVLVKIISKSADDE